MVRRKVLHVRKSMLVSIITSTSLFSSKAASHLSRNIFHLVSCAGTVEQALFTCPSSCHCLSCTDQHTSMVRKSTLKPYSSHSTIFKIMSSFNCGYTQPPLQYFLPDHCLCLNQGVGCTQVLLHPLYPGHV